MFLIKKLKNKSSYSIRFIAFILAFSLLCVSGISINGAFLLIAYANTATPSTNSEEAKTAREYGQNISQKISDEGIVLLKNTSNSLPLNSKKLNVFGTSAIHFKHGNAQASSEYDTQATSFYDGLSSAGIEINDELYEAYKEIENSQNKNETSGFMQFFSSLFSSKKATSTQQEAAMSELDDTLITNAKNFSNNALIVVSTPAIEEDFYTEEQLEITQNTQDLIETVCNNFNNVTIVINSGNAMNLSFVENYKNIKSVLWAGIPGPYGTYSLGKILTGQLNPSGRLVDTYTYETSSSPASQNITSSKYTNADACVMHYQEDIYLGYRFYESFYQDDEKGYKSAVQYPFGYGLSYTQFNWEVVEQKATEKYIDVAVNVTNTGNKAGQDVVQLYYSPPYTENGIEKSAISLGGFAKTRVLEPGKTEQIALRIPTRDMASYNTKNAYYVLEKGTYTIKLGKNIHDIYSRFDYELEKNITYKTDPNTDTEYTTVLQASNNDLPYLSRANWEKTWPENTDTLYTANNTVKQTLKQTIEISDDEPSTTGADSKLNLPDLQNLDYDDVLWDDFLDQLTVDEMIHYVTHSEYQTQEISRLNIPSGYALNGESGLVSSYKNFVAAAYPSEVVLGSSWNEDLAYKMGEAIGKEAMAYGVQGWYAPALNIHRTAFNTQNANTFSEDPVLTGILGASVAKGAQNSHITIYMKYFAFNEMAQDDTLLFIEISEQALREIYLRPFKICLQQAKVTGVISNPAYIGTQEVEQNLNTILRDEWGFNGIVACDTTFSAIPAEQAILNGNNVLLNSEMATKNEKQLKKAYKQNPALVTSMLENSMHIVLYTLLQTYLFTE